MRSTPRFVITRRAALAATAGFAAARAFPARADSTETIRLGVSAPPTAQFAQEDCG